MERVEVHGRYTLERKEFPQLIGRLRSLGYRVVGPTVRDGAIVYGDIRTEQDLPIGWTEKQDAGKYRLERRPDAALFGYNLGPHSWKKYLFLPHERLWTARRTEQGFDVVPEPADGAPLAFLGVRACGIAAMGVQDRVFAKNYADPGYVARRSRSLTIAVQCGQAAKTCFCVSMGTGPRGPGRIRSFADGDPDPLPSPLPRRSGLRARRRGAAGRAARGRPRRARRGRPPRRGADHRLDGPVCVHRGDP